MTPQSGTDLTSSPIPVNPELPPQPVEQSSPTPETPDVSSVEADKRAIESATLETHTAESGQVFKTLRAPAEMIQTPIPTEAAVESMEQDKILKEVEKILVDGLFTVDKKTGAISGLFTELSDDRKPVFKETGERVAKEITALIQQGKLEGKDVYEDIEQWFKLIPKTNEPWRKQEATIKMDKILLLADAIKRDTSMKSS